MILPGRNFARFLIMAFMLFCLVMRTAYQGKQFKFIQQDMRKANVRTMSELRERNYSLMIFKGYKVHYENMDFFKALSRVETVETREELLSRMSNLKHDARDFVIGNSFDIGLHELYINKSLSILPEPLMTNNVAFTFRRDISAYDHFNRVFTKLIESGIAKRIADKYNFDFTLKDSQAGPMVLTLEQLAIGFEIWLLFLLISFCMFLIEILGFYLSKYFCKRSQNVTKNQKRLKKLQLLSSPQIRVWSKKT